MGKIKIGFSPLFIILTFIIVYFGWFVQFAIYLLVLILHEMAHYVVAKLYGYRLNKIIFMPYGAGLSGESNIFVPKHEVIIALAGPLLNILLVLICVVCWWVFPVTFYYTETFMLANLVLGMFNFLPIFPLDGGRIIVALFCEKTSKIKLYRIMEIVAFAFSGLFAVLFVLSVFYKLNLTLIFISVFLFISAFDYNKNVYYERTYIKNFANNVNHLKPLEVKTYAVNIKMPIYKLVKYIKGNNYTQFLICNDDGAVVQTISEQQLKNLLLNNNLKK